jgi:hypothetical protein
MRTWCQPAWRAHPQTCSGRSGSRGGALPTSSWCTLNGTRTTTALQLDGVLVGPALCSFSSMQSCAIPVRPHWPRAWIGITWGPWGFAHSCPKKHGLFLSDSSGLALGKGIRGVPGVLLILAHAKLCHSCQTTMASPLDRVTWVPWGLDHSCPCNLATSLLRTTAVKTATLSRAEAPKCPGSSRVPHLTSMLSSPVC